MNNNVELIKLVINNYLDKIQLIINQDMVVLEYMYIINNEKDVYKTIEVTELEDKYCLKFYPEATTKIITLDEFSDIFDIVDKKIKKRRNLKNNRTKIRLDTKNIRKRNKETGKRTTIHKRKI